MSKSKSVRAVKWLHHLVWCRCVSVKLLNIYDTPGCHYDDDRNIAFSSKGAKYNGMHWEINDSVEHDFNLMAASPDLLAALQQLLEIYDDHSGKVWTTSSKRRALGNARAAVNKALGEAK
ncbi:hypothetical protein seszw2t2_62 [Salmonella phage seszw]|nr:hypothetical protein seszw2t2_62 [Salmonella phage seszw]